MRKTQIKKTTQLQVLVLLCICFVAKGRKTVMEFRGDKDVKTNRPIIGILAQDDSTLAKLNKFGDSYIATSYVKYVEAAGARVIPIKNNETNQELKKFFSSINGVVFPGGSADLFKSKYSKTAKIIFDLAVKANDKGDHFPIWATCLGFELLHILVAKGKDVRRNCDAENLSIPVNFKKDFRESRMFRSAPEKIVDYLGTHNITMNMHDACITVKDFKKEKNLKKFFRIISTNRDRQNKMEFISLVEAINYPFYASQFHPEKNQFEWAREEDINHSIQAIESAQYLANFFVNQARMSRHRFPNHKEERKALVFQYQARPCLESIYHFDECYFF